jgi:hypothetical protein
LYLERRSKLTSRMMPARPKKNTLMTSVDRTRVRTQPVSIISSPTGEGQRDKGQESVEESYLIRREEQLPRGLVSRR